MTKGLLEHPVPGMFEPDSVFQALCGDADNALWLDDHGDRGSGVSYLATARACDLSSSWQGQVRGAHQTMAGEASSGDTKVLSYPLGIHVVIPYGFAHETLGVEVAQAQDERPQALVVERLVAIDHATGQLTLVAWGAAWEGELGLWKENVLTALAGLGSRDSLSAQQENLRVTPEGTPRVVWRKSAQQYRAMIADAQEAIARGDAYQLCLTTQMSSADALDPLALHRMMRKSNPTHHQAYVRMGDLTIVSASPETFVDISPSGMVTTRPIKGTRPRGATLEEDDFLAEELIASDKERAENLMIVDLMRNDLSRVCEVGSIAVPELLVVESYARVHQLVSTVTGQLLPGLDPLDVLTSAFPAGSMTGAPKRRAVELLNQWEGGPRGYYAGTYGVWRVDNSATFAMTIRAVVATPEGFSLGVGGGITALSDPASEISEVGIKAQAFLEALGVDQVEYS